MPNLLRFVQIIFLVVLGSLQSLAMELTFYGGPNTHISVHQCCNSSGTRNGLGLIGALDLELFGNFEMAAFTTGKWNEFSLLYPLHLLGKAPETHLDSNSGDSTKRVRRWRIVSSFGAGYFNHTVTTKDLGLPLLTSGLLVNNINRLHLALGENWGLSGLIQFSWSISKSGSSILYGTYLGPSYDF